MAEIYVYDKNCENFDNFGLVGALTPTSCIFEEEANGMSEITLKHPIDEFGRHSHLKSENLLMVEVPVRTTPEIIDGQIVTTVEQWTVKNASTITKGQRTLYKKNSGSRRIKVLPGGLSVTVVNKPADGRYKVKCRYGTGYMDRAGLDFVQVQTIADNSQSIESVQPAWTVKPQLFRIYNVEKSIDGITVSARHISYDLLYNLTSYKNTGSASCIAALGSIMRNCTAPHGFEAFTNIASARTGLNFEEVNPIDAILNPESGLTVLYQCSLVRDNWELFLLHDPGLNRGVTVEYGKNMIGINASENYENIVTRIVPLGETKDGKPLYLNGTKYIDSGRINDYAVPRVQTLKCENCKVGTGGVTTSIAWARMREQALAVFANGGDLPEIEMSVDFVNLGDTTEYAQYRDLERLFLWDYVLIRHKLLNIDVTARIVAIEWDCVADRMNKMEIGKVGKTLANSGITSWQVPVGFSGSKIASESIGSGALQTDIIATRHIQAESINTDALQAACVTALKIAAGAITADKLDANTIDAKIANIVVANLTTANIQSADIDWASINNLTAQIADISKAHLTDADIEWAQITRLTAAIADVAQAQIENATISTAQIENLTAAVTTILDARIGSVDIGFAQIKDLITGTAIITEGVGGKLMISRLAVTEANIVSLSVGELMVKGADGRLYRLGVDEAGMVTTELVQIEGADVAGSTLTGDKMIENTITTRELNAQNIFADSAMIRELIAANLDVGTLFAREATIAALNAADISGNASLNLYVKQADLSTYLRLTTGQVELGETDGEVKVQLRTGDNAGLYIVEGAQANAYFGQNKARIERLEMGEAILIGNTAIVAQNNGDDVYWLGR